LTPLIENENSIMTTYTPSQFNALAGLVRLDEPERIATGSVLLRGMTADAAAAQAGIKQSAVADALEKCRQAECLARAVVWAPPASRVAAHETAISDFP